MVDTTRPPVRLRTRPSPNTQTGGSGAPDGPAPTTAAHAQGVRHRECPAPAPVRLDDAALPAPQEPGSCARQRDYEVGYGKPPKDTRFKKGQSGNPRGRRKGSKNLFTLVLEELDHPIAVREDGRSCKVRACSALAKRLVHKALSGHDRSIELLFKLVGIRADSTATPAETADGGAEPFTAGELSILEDFKQQTIQEHELASRAADAATADDRGGAS
jgi:uncharacterized protein DUF5681